MIYVIICAASITLGILAFQKSAGSLNPCKINIISLTFYYLLLQSVLGATLVLLGFTKHYTILRLANATKYTEIGAFTVLIMFVTFPLIILAFLKMFKVNAKKEYEGYLTKKPEIHNSTICFAIVLASSIVCSFLLFFLLFKIGYIPIINLICNRNMDFAIERAHNVGLTILGIEQIKNVMVLFAIPLLSYIAFSFSLCTREIRWVIITFILVVESIIVKTYDFSKAPLVLYFAVIFLIYLMYKGGINYRILLYILSFLLILLVAAYRLIGFNKSFFDIYNGILGRTFFTEFGILCMHLEVFTDYIAKLGGRSLYPTVLTLLGLNPGSHIRSSQVVMEVYNPEGVHDGVAGVMNTLYIGEAYANWGIIGIIFSVIWVAFLITSVFVVFIKLKKTPISIAYFAAITQQLTSCLQGGFVDYIYNANIIMTMLSFAILYFISNNHYSKGKQHEQKK